MSLQHASLDVSPQRLPRRPGRPGDRQERRLLLGDRGRGRAGAQVGGGQGGLLET